MISNIVVQLHHTSTGTPLFVLPFHHLLELGYKRVFGCVIRNFRVFYPAYPPYGNFVTDDLRKVFGDELVWSPEAQKQAQHCQVAEQHVEATTLPPEAESITYKFEPYHHQLEGLVRSYWYPRTGLFFHPGLGKTKVTVDLFRLLQHTGESVRALVLCPTPNLAVNWSREIELHGQGDLTCVPVCTSTGGNLAKKKRLEMYEGLDWDNTNIVVLSYGLCVQDIAIIKEWPFNILVCDESHYLQTPDSRRTRHVLSVARCYRRIFLTGTPSQGDPNHLYGQLRCAGSFLADDNYWKYRQRYSSFYVWFRCRSCGARHGGNEKDTGRGTKLVAPDECPKCASEKFARIQQISGFKNLHVLQRTVGYMALRRKQEECLDLPERHIIDYAYRLDRKSKQIYNDLVRSTTTEINAGTTFALKERSQRVNKLLQVLSGFLIQDNKEVISFDKQPKLEVLWELLEAILADDENKTIIWCYFKHELNLIEALLKKEKIGYVRVDGATRDRIALQDRFNEKPDCRVYLSQMSTGIGITLNAANYVIYAGWTYDLKPYLQSRERNYRIGQTRKVTVYRLHVPRSIHAFVASALDLKENVSEALSNRFVCMTCKHGPRCMKKNIKPFTSDCKVCDSEVSKIKTAPMTL